MFFSNEIVVLAILTKLGIFPIYYWFILWVRLEINIISFIPIIIIKSKLSVNVRIKYFIIQRFSSRIFILNSLLTLNSLMFFSNEIVVLAILTKLGIFPIYYWFPAVCEGLSWNNIFLLITLQKIIPIYICLNTDRKMIIFRVIFRGSIRIFLLFNSTCLRKILAFSSMHNLSWIIIRRIINNNYWVLFIIIYSIIIFEIRQRFHKKITRLLDKLFL